MFAAVPLDVTIFNQQFADLIVQRQALVIAWAYDPRLLPGLTCAQIFKCDTVDSSRGSSGIWASSRALLRAGVSTGSDRDSPLICNVAFVIVQTICRIGSMSESSKLFLDATWIYASLEQP